MEKPEEAELLEVVNERNEVVGILPRHEVHRKKLAHRASHIFVFNLKNELFLQKRADTKSELPGYYDSSAAGHLQPYESYDVCAVRELQEELSITADLTRIGDMAACEGNALEHVALFVCRTDKTPIINRKEVESGRFYPIYEIERWISRGSEMLSPGFVLLFKKYRTQRDAFLSSFIPSSSL